MPERQRLPFPKSRELRALPLNPQTLPGQPRIRLDPASLGPYLDQDLTTPKLDRLAPHLWLVATPDSKHISSLTRQGTRGRTIVLTEWPEAHLIWFNDRIFVKPLPEYLLSYAFWDEHLCVAKPSAHQIQRVRAAKGFLRSYAYLITHESDFRIAQSIGNPSQRIIPDNISYEDFCSFMLDIVDLPDQDVTPRWHFGELRLARLNFWTKSERPSFTFFSISLKCNMDISIRMNILMAAALVFLREQNFMKVRRGYDDTINRYFAPLAFLFAFFSVSLSAMRKYAGDMLRHCHTLIAHQ